MLSSPIAAFYLFIFYVDATSSASNTRANFPQQAFSMLTKQSSQAAFKITKAGAKVGAKASAKVAQVVVDISEKVTSSYGTFLLMC